MNNPELSSAQQAETFITQQTRTALAYVRERRRHFQRTGLLVAMHALKISHYSSVVTISIIILGALVSTKAVVDNLLGATNIIDVVTYALVGMLIAVLSSLESTFKWNQKAAELRLITAKCRRAEHAIDIGLRTIHSEDLEAATALLKQVDTALDEIEGEALKLGVNLHMPLSPDMPSARMKKQVALPAEKNTCELFNTVKDTAHTLDKVSGL